MKKLPSERSPTARVIRLPYPKDENGKPLCRWCQAPVKPPRKSWCSDKCVGEYRDRYDNAHQRRQVRTRDKGVCQKCGLDTQKVAKEALALRSDKAAQAELLAKYGFRLTDLGRGHSLWQADHTIPVVEGGGGAHWDQLRTLCLPCHRAESAALMARRRAARTKVEGLQRGVYLPHSGARSHNPRAIKMVHVVVFSGPQDAINRVVREQLVLLVNGYAQVGQSNTWLVAYHQPAGVLRDLLGSTPGVAVFVARLSGNWGIRGFPDVANWMEIAVRHF